MDSPILIPFFTFRCRRAYIGLRRIAFFHVVTILIRVIPIVVGPIDGSFEIDEHSSDDFPMILEKPNKRNKHRERKVSAEETKRERNFSRHFVPFLWTNGRQARGIARAVIDPEKRNLPPRFRSVRLLLFLERVIMWNNTKKGGRKREQRAAA